MCPLSRPVDFHCVTNCGCERLAICIVTYPDSGMVTSAMSASCQEIQNIIPSTPTSVRMAVMSWLSACWSVWPRLSMSLVTRERMSPRDSLSKYRSGSRPSLCSTC